VWSGSQGKENGLVDELGGLDRAVQVAKELANIPAGDSVRLVRYPEERNFFQQLMQREKDTTSQSQSLESMLRHIVNQMEPIQARVPYELHIR
jgi:protease IV